MERGDKGTHTVRQPLGSSLMHQFNDGHHYFGMSPLGWGFWIMLIVIGFLAYSLIRRNRSGKSS